MTVVMVSLQELLNRVRNTESKFSTPAMTLMTKRQLPLFYLMTMETSLLLDNMLSRDMLRC